MSRAIERFGAVNFSKPRLAAARRSDTPVFAKFELDCVDPLWDAIIETVSSFIRLDDDWDGGGAVAPETALVHMAVELARQLRECSSPAPLRAVAGVNGTVSFEFPGEPFIEIEVVSPYKAEVFEAGKLVSILHADVDT